MRINLLLIALLALLVAACSGGEPTAPPTTRPLPTPTGLPAEPPVEPTPPAAPPISPALPTALPLTPGGGDPSEVLPAPLYFLTGDAMDALQIWRSERDGATVTQVTNESAGVQDFDVSRADGSLLYVSGTELVRSDALGADRTVLFTMPPATSEPNPMMPARALAEPRLSPDGARVAFRLDGVNLLEVATGKVEQILADDPVPVEGPFETLLRFYHVNSWSPDGQRLLITAAYFMEGGELAIYDLATRELVTLQSNEGMPCCSFAWAPDSQSLFIANDLPGMMSAGLWRAEVASGTVQTLTQEEPDSRLPSVMVAHPFISGGGDLYAWKRTMPTGGTAQDPYLLTPLMERTTVPQAGDPAAWQVVNEQPLRPIEVLWHPNAHGAIVSAEEGQGWLETGNPLIWVPTDGGDIYPLPARGRTLRWAP